MTRVAQGLGGAAYRKVNTLRDMDARKRSNWSLVRYFALAALFRQTCGDVS